MIGHFRSIFAFICAAYTPAQLTEYAKGTTVSTSAQKL